MVGKKLDLAVHAQLDVLAFNRGNLLPDALHHPAQAVFDHTPGPRLARQVLVESQLDAFLAPIFHIGKTDNVRCRLAFRVFALVFTPVVDSFDPQPLDVMGHTFFNLALQPDKILVLVGQLFVQLTQRHFQQPGQRRELGFRRLHIIGNCPDAGRRHAGRKNQPIAIENPAPICREFQGSRETHFTLALEKSVPEKLHVGGTPCQAHKGQSDARHNEFAAPDGCFAGQQWARGVANTFTHGVPPRRQPPLRPSHTG